MCIRDRYDANGGNGTMTDAKEYYSGDAITVKENTFTYAHKHFVKFTLDAAGTQEIPADFKMGQADVTLYAQWEDDATYNVLYDANGGSGTMLDAKAVSYTHLDVYKRQRLLVPMAAVKRRCST